MTRRGLMIRILLVVSIYAIAIGLGCFIRFSYPKREDLHYVLYKDLIPLIVAIPAAWLAYCFQRRSSYLQQLRSVWDDAVDAVRGATRYASMIRPSSDDQGEVLADIGAAMDGIRSLSRRTDSLPIVSLDEIRRQIKALGADQDIAPIKAEAARLAIQGHWDIASNKLLLEFDRVRFCRQPRRPPPERSASTGPHLPIGDRTAERQVVP